MHFALKDMAHRTQLQRPMAAARPRASKTLRSSRQSPMSRPGRSRRIVSIGRCKVEVGLAGSGKNFPVRDWPFPEKS